MSHVSQSTGAIALLWDGHIRQSVAKHTINIFCNDYFVYNKDIHIPLHVLPRRRSPVDSLTRVQMTTLYYQPCFIDDIYLLCRIYIGIHCLYGWIFSPCLKKYFIYTIFEVINQQSYWKTSYFSFTWSLLLFWWTA